MLWLWKMSSLKLALQQAIEYSQAQKIKIPADLYLRAFKVGAVKASASIDEASAEYHDRITEALTTFFEGGSITAPKNEFKRAMVDAFGEVFNQGWVDGGNQLPVEGEALDWFEARVNAEFGFIDMLFEEAKQLRKEEGFDFFAWVTARADGYTRTLREVYNQAKLRVSKDIMVSFLGDDGAESCDDCQKYKGQRHKISWFVKRNAVPPFGVGLECHRGGRCQHGLFDDKGNQVTV